MDKITPERRSHNMSRIRSKNTKPEILVRKIAHSMGYRFRLHYKHLPGNPDLVFPSRSKVIFVHGCFWHQHPDPACKDARPPRSNSEYWGPKLARNVERDNISIEKLKSIGWFSLTIWECQTKNDAELRNMIAEFLG